MIRFGTSGWRAIIAEDFTFANVALVTRAIARHLNDRDLHGCIIGHDTRFLAERFASLAASILREEGLEALVASEPIPTPALSAAVRSRQGTVAINFTASHNPPSYAGIKISTERGAPAPAEMTMAIEEEIRRLEEEEATLLPRDEIVTTPDLDSSYRNLLKKQVMLEDIARAGLRLAVDPLYGTARGYLDQLLLEAGTEVHTLHNWRDVYFGGHEPDCTETSLSELIDCVRRDRFDLGLATDGDADRFGIVDQAGHFIQANQIIALLLDYLVTHRGFRGDVVRTVATTHLVDRVANKHGISTIETPVGFKHFAPFLEDGDVVLGGEESAGLSIQGHLPEKDGILACLLVAEMRATIEEPLKRILARLHREVGPIVTRRIDRPLSKEQRERLDHQLQSPPDHLQNDPVEKIVTKDGMKLLLNSGAWFMVRPSGTEPVARYYAEAESLEKLEGIIEAGERWLEGAASRHL